MAETYTIHDLATEMQTWLTFPPDVLERASKSNISTINNPTFKRLVRDWTNGGYDDAPEYVGYQIELILDKDNK